MGNVCDLCEGDDASGDTDNDGVCDNIDICPGFDDKVDSDTDSVPDGCDLCVGDNTGGDTDGDGVCADSDCDDNNSSAALIDQCGICGGDNSTCLIFKDGFESGDASAWSRTSP